MTEAVSKEDSLDLARVLMRTACWLSAMDDAGGSSSHQEERKATFDTLRKFRNEADYKTLVPVFDAALESYKAWDTWGKDVSNFTRELKERAPEMSLVLRQCVYDLGYCVATRYRERNWLIAFLASIKVSLQNFLSPKEERVDLPEYLNISVVEKSALNELAEILDLPHRIII